MPRHSTFSLGIAAMVASLGLNGSAIAQTWDPIVIHPDGSRSTPSPTSDSNADAWPDDPFATLTDGDLWYAAAPAHTVAALRWSTGDDAIQTVDLEVTRSDNTSQRFRIQAPGSLAAPGETAVLLVGIAADLDSLFGDAQAAAIAPPEGFELLPGGQYIEISVLISPDGGVTFDELDPARLQDAPIRLRIENLTANVDSIPVLYEHPTYIASDPHTGLTPLAEPGAWTPAPSMTLPYSERDPEETAEPVYLDADLRSLSVFAPMTGAEATPTDPDTAVNEPDPNDTSTDLLPVIVDPDVTPLDTTETTPLDSTDQPPSADSEGDLALLSSPPIFVFVDFLYTGVEKGTNTQPFNTMEEGVSSVASGGYIIVGNGDSNETGLVIDKPVTIQPWNPTDVARIGDEFTCGPSESFTYNGFAVAPGLDIAPDASITMTNPPLIRLVPDGGYLAGAVWTHRKLRVERGFDISFGFQIARETGAPGPDGISFVIQNAGPAPSLTPGGNMGYTGIVDSVAVEFDCFQNLGYNDPAFDHVSVHSGGIGQPNSANHSYSLGMASTVTQLDNGIGQEARIIYDPRARTLEVRINTIPIVVVQDFRLEEHMQLDGGSAYLGIMSSTGDPNNAVGPNLLYSWSASFPQSCEEVYWGKPDHHTSDLGYNGDIFDHHITGNFLQAGDEISEQFSYISDDIGLTQVDIDSIVGYAPGTWEIVQDTRHGVFGLWRGRSQQNQNIADAEFDEHSIDTRNRQAFIDLFNGAGVGTLVLKQTMRHVNTGVAVAEHRLIFHFVKMAPETTEDVEEPLGQPDCEFTDAFGFMFHQVVQKQNARNESVWAAAHLSIPQMPCP